MEFDFHGWRRDIEAAIQARDGGQTAILLDRMEAVFAELEDDGQPRPDFDPDDTEGLT